MVVTTLKGSLYAMGYDAGVAHQLAIWRVVAESRRRFHSDNCDVSALNRALYRRGKMVRVRHPGAWEHLHGIADGSGIPLRDLIHINFGVPCRSAFLYESACSLAGFQKSAQGPIVGGNLDDPAWHYLSWEIPDTGYAAIFVSLPGFYAKWGGMNEHGLCVTGASSGVTMPGSVDDVAVSRHTLRVWSPREILTHCRTLDEATDIIRDKRFPANNYIIGDTNSVAQIEKRGNGTLDVYCNESVDAPFCAGNIRRASFEKYGDTSRLRGIHKNALGRYINLRKVMIENFKLPGVAAMRRVLTYHAGGRLDIATRTCPCHTGTSVSIICIPRQRVVLVGFAPPCVGDYQKLSFDEIR